MLRLDSIKKSFVEPSGNRLPILEIADYQLAFGEQAVLVGQSGGGKTTLLHVIAGVLQPDAGSVTVAGHAPSYCSCR